MAKFEGTQSIPSELLDEYRATLNPHPTGNIVKKRYPFRVPKMQTDKGHPHAAQLTQRQSFLTAITGYKNLSWANKQQWYDTTDDIGPGQWYYNFKMKQALLSAIATKEILLGADSTYSIPLAQNSTSCFVGRVFWPSKLWKINKSTLDVTLLITFATAYGSMRDVLVDSTYIWCLFDSSPARLVRAPIADPSSYTTYTFAAGENGGKSMVDDGTYIWCGLYPSNPKIIRVTKADPATRTTYTLAEISGNLIDLDQDSTYIWAICGNSPPSQPAYIVRIQKSDPTQRINQAISGTNPTAVCLKVDGSVIWVSCAAENPKYRSRLWEILTSDLSDQTIHDIVDIEDPAVGESSWIEDIAINGSYLWVSPLLHKPQLHKIERSDPSNKEGWNVLFLGKNVYRIVIDNDFLYTTHFYGSAGRLCKVYKYLSPYS